MGRVGTLIENETRELSENVLKRGKTKVRDTKLSHNDHEFDDVGQYIATIKRGSRDAVREREHVDKAT